MGSGGGKKPRRFNRDIFRVKLGVGGEPSLEMPIVRAVPPSRAPYKWALFVGEGGALQMKFSGGSSPRPLLKLHL